MKTVEEYAALAEDEAKQYGPVNIARAQVYATLAQAAAMRGYNLGHEYTDGMPESGAKLTDMDRGCTCWQAGYETGCAVNY